MDVSMPFERRRPWEACMTIGEYWQYSANDTQFKSSDELIRILVDVVSRGGNLLLNVGPTPEGIIPAATVERMRAIGEWLGRNGESIRGCAPSPFGALPVGKCTTQGNRLYIHLDALPEGPIVLPGLQNTIIKATLLATGEELGIDNKAKSIAPPAALPDCSVTVVAVELDTDPVVQQLRH